MPTSPEPTPDSPLPALREIRRRLRLGALTKGEIELEQWFVETHIARCERLDVRSTMAEQLRAAYAENTDVSLLFYGHGGTGKSTELAKLSSEIGQSFLIVHFSIKDHLDLVSFDANDLLLVIAEQVLKIAQQTDLGLADDALEDVHDFFAEKTQSHATTRSSNLAVGGKVQAGVNGLLPGLLKIFAGFSADLKIGETRENTYVHRFKQKPGALLTAVNGVLSAVRQSLRSRGQGLLLIVEDLDKLDLAPSRRLFVENTSRLRGLAASVIYTVPIFIVYSPDWGLISRSFTRSYGLPMIKVSECDGQRCQIGHETLLMIINRRLAGASAVPAFTIPAVELAIQKTGGVLQHLFEVLSMSTEISGVTLPVSEDAVRAALDIRRGELWSEITIPSLASEKLVGVERVEQLYERLADHVRANRSGPGQPANTDPINQLLLRCHALIEYNGQRWVGVHPLVEENLIRAGRLARF